MLTSFAVIQPTSKLMPDGWKVLNPSDATNPLSIEVVAEEWLNSISKHRQI